MDRGIFPESLFRDKLRTIKFERFPSESGRFPVSRFCSMRRSVRFMRFAISCGMVPDILFSLNIKSCRLFGRWPMEFGRFPCRLFASNCKFTSLVQLASEGRKVQSPASSWFLPISSVVKLGKCPKEGIMPRNALSRRRISSRFVALAIDAGIGP